MDKTEIGVIVLVNGVAGIISGSLVGGIIPEKVNRDEVLSELGKARYEVDQAIQIPVPGWNLEILVCVRTTLS